MRLVRGVLLSLMVLFGAVPAFAAETVPFDAAQFAAAQHAGRPILIDVRASWCPACAVQKSILAWLGAEPEFKSLVVFTVDFDTRKDLLHRFRAPEQSTLIAFKGASETGRSVGDTNIDSIEKLLRSAAG